MFITATTKDEDRYFLTKTLDDIINDNVCSRARVKSLNAYTVRAELNKELSKTALVMLLVAFTFGVLVFLKFSVLSLIIGGVVYAITHGVLKHYIEKYHNVRLQTFMSTIQKIQEVKDLDRIYDYIDDYTDSEIDRRYVLSLDDLLSLRSVFDYIIEIEGTVRSF